MKRIYTPVKKKTILIVDDDHIVVHIYREKFQSQGFNVEVAADAAIAMQTLKKDPVDLLMLDLCICGMNGVDLLKNIRSVSGLEALPIIALSNAYLGSVARAALEAGANKCAVKGDSTANQILALVHELLAVGHSNSADATSEVVVSNASDTPATPAETEFQQQLVAALLTNAPEALAKLRASSHILARMEQEDLRRDELSKMQRHVRSLAGSAGLVGFSKINKMANALEALLIELQTEPEKITPSVRRTVAQAIDTLASLFEHAANTQKGELLSPKILVVDDEIISRQTISSALGKAGLQATSLDDSLAAQLLLEQDRFDLIFLDVEMPGQSGLDLCMKIREMATNHATPVVFVTAHSDFGSRAQSTLSGGNDFIAKPFLLVELALKALTWLFRESPQPLSTVATQASAPAEAGSHELPLTMMVPV
ncbi:MAG: response regulator, partial [Verrucomicrobiota bacterium]